MSFCARKAGLARGLKNVVPVTDIPTFLCPGLLRTANLPIRNCHLRHMPLVTRHETRRFLSVQTVDVGELTDVTVQAHKEAAKQYESRAQAVLPRQCPGCGALSQRVLDNEAGYYDITRRGVRKYIVGAKADGKEASEEDVIVQKALDNANALGLGLGLEDTVISSSKSSQTLEPPVCDRCHNLKEHSTGASIIHPSMRSIQDTIFESPHKYNHIYHVIDAADFPMSLIPGLHKLLHLTPQRSLNRRSKTEKFYHGQKTEVSFIIQRSDLLGSSKEAVDKLMPYLRETLRDALGRSGKDARLGNVRCVSAKMAWWTKELKEEIWERGGGGWFVGKVNVGKSQLLRDVFPKGRGQGVDIQRLEQEENASGLASLSPPEEDLDGQTASDLVDEAEIDETTWGEEEVLDTRSLLPPLPAEVNYPAMPLVNSLPGTTASPIRLPFGKGKGELVDLPGLSRSDLEQHVLPAHHSSLVMRTRVRPTQQVLKPGQSLLLGGFIRITPTTPDVVFLAYAFTPIEPHTTRTEDKAIPIQLQTRESGIENISVPGTGKKIKSAGTYYLKWDVTKDRSGPLTSRVAGNLSPEVLPYKIFSTDILIEGLGWVELAAQVRKPRSTQPEHHSGGFHTKDIQTFQDAFGETNDVPEDAIDPLWPTVEVFTPGGKFVGQRRPMNAYVRMYKKPSRESTKGRPRKSMKGVKKMEKIRRREAV